MIRKISCVLLSLLLFGACQEDVYITSEGFNASMVAYASISNDSVVSVNLTKSIAPASGDGLSFPSIDNADISILDSKGIVVCRPINTDNEGNYYGTIKVNEEEDYSLLVKSELGTMRSEVIKPVDVTPEELQLNISEFTLGNFNYTHKLIINIPSSYFKYSPKTLAVSLTGIDTESQESFSILPNTTELFDFQFLCDYEFGTNNDIVFQLDENCSTISENVAIEIVFSNEEVLFDQENLLTDEISVNFSIYSSSYYRFISDFIKYDGIDLFFAIPGNPYSSFDNGFGYFASRRDMCTNIKL